ncbi:glycoside hydrolase family 9 protein [Cohnella sp. GbtcB17]|uniref:glycoside hydrolase family 9 protein n=1 Tax=Cohnella sp. GbtcB17 TaxID=2824762 RepID=UPI001C2FF82C|nr:glycoside hydrolase family 9 protein [Cohnella sp. GbtcB17]
MLSSKRSIWAALLCLCLIAGSWSATGASAAEALPGVTVQKYIMIDQFGYQPDGDKVAVLVDPQVGFNAADSYTPGSTMQVRRVSDDEVVFSGVPKVWNGGITQEKSGDRGWWFDFSQVTAVGDYYIYDVDNHFKSYNFTISPDVYKDVLKAAIKTYYYQRIGTPHLAQHAGAAFADDAALIGPGQDSQARSVFDRDNPATERDLSGGWMDAGDYNKYVTYTAQPINELLSAYEQKPDIFTDDYNIPESGNGIPDIIDEVKWELDWLKKMQDEDGGVLMKVGFPSHGKTGDYNDRPSRITFQRYYLPKTSASTVVTALNFAHAAVTLRQFPELASYAADLRERAIKAWEWYQNNPKETNVDNGDVEAGDADMALDRQAQVATVASAYLFALTGDQLYHDYFKANYTTTWPMSDAYWGLYYGEQADGVMFYTTLPNADPAVKAHILERRDLHDFSQSFEDNDDLYRSFVPDFSYHWGSLQVRARSGASSYDFYQYDLNPEKRDNFYKKAQNVLHYFHGVNPFAFTYLTNMDAYGAENSIKQIYHSWFADKTQWDNAPPGFLPGGPSEQYTGSQSPPLNQPAQKTYKDWNAISNDDPAERSWEITENGIYYQAGYIKLLAKFVPEPALAAQAPQTPANLTATAAESTTAIQLNWSRSPGATSYDVELDGAVRENVQTLFITHDGLQPGTEHSYRVRAKNAIGASAWSPLLMGTTSVPPLPPETPTGLKAEPASAFVMNVSWNAADRTKKYELEVDGTVVNNAKQTAYKHKGLDPVSTHTYRVRAVNLGGTSAWSAPVTVTTPVAPPTNVIDLSHNGDNGYTFGQANDQVKRYQTFIADMYPVLTSVEVMLRKFGNASDATVALYATAADGKPTGNALSTAKIAANTVTEDFKALSAPLKYSGLQKGKKYAIVLGQTTPSSQNNIYEWLAGYNVSNDIEFGKFNGSAYVDESDIGDGWTKLYVAQSANPQPQPPAVPTDLTATAASSTSITLGWTAATGATGYQIEIDGSTTYVSTTGATYTHSGLAAGSTHKYRVRAVNAAGTSGWSALATATTSQNQPQPPAVPTGLTATATSSTSISLGWTAVTGATGYQIEIDGSPTYVSTTGATYTHSGLAAGSTHKYRVRAVNAAGTSGWTALVTATTPGQSSSSVIDISHNGTDGYTFGETSDQIKRYQTFAANANKKLTKVEVKVKKYNNPADLVVTLYATKDNKPTGSALATATVKASAIGEDFAVVSVPLSYGNLASGTTYAIVLGQSKNSDYANYEWSTSEVSAGLKYGKYSGGKWIDESGIGDGWLKVYVGQ